jgi:hypothetical protein
MQLKQITSRRCSCFLHRLALINAICNSTPRMHCITRSAAENAYSVAWRLLNDTTCIRLSASFPSFPSEKVARIIYRRTSSDTMRNDQSRSKNFSDTLDEAASCNNIDWSTPLDDVNMHNVTRCITMAVHLCHLER